MTADIEISEKELNQQIDTMLDQGKSLVVKDQESLQVANQFLVELSKLRKKRVAWFKDLVDAAHKAHKALTKRRSEALEPIDQTDRAVRALTGEYVAKEKEKERKKQEKLDRQAEEKARKKEEKLREKAENEEDPDKKAELEEQADNVYVEPKIAESTVDKTSKVQGGGSVSFKDDIEVEVTDFKAFMEKVASGAIPEHIVEIKLAKLKQFVKVNAVKNGMIPGIRIKDIQVQSVRG